MTPVLRWVRRAGLSALAAAAVSGCAMKSDVRMLQTEMMRMQQHQDSVLLEIQRQNRLLLDSVRTTISLTVDARGTTANQLRQFDQSLARFGELVGQVMGTLNRIDQRLAALEQRPGVGAGAGSPSAGGSADEYYTTGMEMMQQGSYATARMAFQQLVQEFPQHERAPDAQFQLGQAFYHEGQFTEAYAALELVAAQWSDAPRAAEALFRAGEIAEGRREFAKARAYYQRVTQAYPRSDAARLATQKLRSLPR
jgi:tol-pal system protein YbgF